MFAMINVHVQMMISLRAPVGFRCSLDIMKPPVNPPTAPANADDNAVQ